MGKFTTQDFIEKAKAVHGDTYIYDENRINYVNNKTKIPIICREHGEFWQTPNEHLIGHGCSICGKLLATKKKSKPFSQFEEEARKVHGDKYEYDASTYTTTLKKMRIICPEHGEFWQTPANHLRGRGCIKCANKRKSIIKRSDFAHFKEKAKKIHQDKYIYNDNNYVDCYTKIRITCPKHGDFWQTPDRHLAGCGCPKCGIEKVSLTNRLGFIQFKERAEQIHKGKYLYNDENFIKCNTKIKITCPKHGDFWQTPASHLNGQGCPHCGNKVSKAEEEINKFINDSLNLKTITRDRGLLGKRLECDIVVPSYHLAIEFNGLRWHSEQYNKDKNYHLHKTELAGSKDYHLIHIFEDEWMEHKDIVLSKIRHMLGCDLDKPVVGARKCTIKTLSKPLTEQFLTTYHLQGFTPSTALYGAYFGDVLIGVMTFKKEKEGVWNFNRFATHTDYRLPGLASKMFKQFVKDNNPTEVKAFLDRRWSHCDNNLYNKIGFKLVETLSTDYCYIGKSKGKRFSKSKFNKQKLSKKYDLPLTMTEKEMAKQLGYYRIWDCGQYKYVWNSSTQM